MRSRDLNITELRAQESLMTPCVIRSGEIDDAEKIKINDDAKGDFLSKLKNEDFDPSLFPLNAIDGQYYSETLNNERSHGPYGKWIQGTFDVISTALITSSHFTVERINEASKDIQEVDFSFAREMIRNGPDEIHSKWGRDKNHPYSKLTLIRTKLPVLVGDKVEEFFFEKFLTIYSYLENGKRVSTTTPIHAHPHNHEVIYFLAHGHDSYVEEFEYGYKIDGKEIDLSNSSDREVFVNTNYKDVELFQKKKVRIEPSNEPIGLDAFDSENLLYSEALYGSSEGLYRPHKVKIHDNGEDTLFYSINNYWSRTGKVFVYDENGSIKETWKN